MSLGHEGCNSIPRLMKIDSIKILRFFHIFNLIAAATAVAITFNLVWVFDVPDEPAHLQRTSEIASGHSKLLISDGKIGRAFAKALPFKKIDSELNSESNRKLLQSIQSVDFTATTKTSNNIVLWNPAAPYSTFNYLHQAAAYKLVATFHGSLESAYWLIRLFSSLIFISIFTYCSNKTLQAINTSVTAIFILPIISIPMVIFLSVSASGDSSIIFASIIATLSVTKLADETSSHAKQERRNINLILFLVGSITVSCLTLMSKITYMPISLFFAFTLLRCLASTKQYKMGLFVNRFTKAGILIIVAGAIERLATSSRLKPLMTATWSAALGHNFNDPYNLTLFFKKLINTILSAGHRDFYQKSFVGIFGWLNKHLSAQEYHLISVSLLAWTSLNIIICLINNSSEAHALQDKYFNILDKNSKQILGLCLLLSFVAIFYPLYSVWSPNTIPSIEGVQGRYFLPIFITFAILIYSCKTTGQSNNTNVLAHQSNALYLMKTSSFSLSILFSVIYTKSILSFYG